MSGRAEPLVDVEGDGGEALLLQYIEDETERPSEAVAVHREAALIEIHYTYSEKKNLT